MTPEEAVAELRDRLTTGRLNTVKGLIDACVVTAKAEETRRCAALLTKQSDELIRTGDYSVATYVQRIRDSILRTGGLKVEDGVAK